MRFRTLGTAASCIASPAAPAFKAPACLLARLLARVPLQAWRQQVLACQTCFWIPS